METIQNNLKVNHLESIGDKQNMMKGGERKMSDTLEKRLPRTGEVHGWDGSDFRFGMVSKYSLVGFCSEESKDIMYVRADWDSICGSSNPNGYGSMDQHGYMIKQFKTVQEREKAYRNYVDYKMPNGSY